MPEIRENPGIWTVIVTVDTDPETMGAMEAHARFGLERFPEYAGFIAGALHLSRDHRRLVQYLQWRAEADYVACRDDPVWDDLPSTRAFMRAVGEERAVVDARSFYVSTTTDRA